MSRQSLLRYTSEPCIPFHSRRASSKPESWVVFLPQDLHSNQKRVGPLPTWTLAAGGIEQTAQSRMGRPGVCDAERSRGSRKHLFPGQVSVERLL